MMWGVTHARIVLAVAVAGVMVRHPPGVGADPGSLADVYSPYFSVVADTSPPPQEVGGLTLCMCRYLCYTDDRCASFSYEEGADRSKSVCYLPSPDATVIGYKRGDGLVTFVKETLTKLNFTLGNVTYFYVDNKAPFDDVALFCPMGARLACPSDPDDYRALMNYIQGNEELKIREFWVDALYSDEKAWHWCDGTPLPSSREFPWGESAPIAKDSSHAGLMSFAFGHKLLDYKKHNQFHVLCQLPA